MRWMICGFCIAGLAAQEAPRPKDEREYALVQQAIAERDAAKRLETLETWSKEYESSNLNKLRAQLLLRTYRETGPARKTVEAAEKLLVLDPEDFSARYTLASLAPSLSETSEAALSRAEQSSRALLDGGIAAQFSEKERPESVPAEAWANARKEAHAASLRTLAWVAMQRNEHAAAEARLVEALGVDPASAQASYWLAQSVLAQRNPSKNELAFFSLARAATMTGVGELPIASREKIHSYLKTTYEAFAGTLEGLEDLERLAASSALPPADMPRILSAEERRRIAEQNFCEERPLECAYRTLRSALEGDIGEGIWEDLRGKVSPQMRLYVVSNVPPDRPLELRMSSTKGGQTELVLRLSNRLREALPLGRIVTLEGVASTLQREPFLLTLDQGRIVE